MEAIRFGGKMNDRDERVAALSNMVLYNSMNDKQYVDGAPHIKHRDIRELYGKLVVQVFDQAKESVIVPNVLDLGAGEGSVTLPFLELGAKVTAVDISENQLSALQNRCKRYGDSLEAQCMDISDFLSSTTPKYNIIVVNSFLHHIPDYLRLIRSAVTRLAPSGQFFAFQDPLRYDTVEKPTKLFSEMGYLVWRSRRGNIMRGVKTRIRRLRGIYSDEHEVDFAEYHVVRNGVDQNAIVALLAEEGFDSTLIRYFSTQSPAFQFIGTRLGMKNKFGIIARKKEA